MDTIGMDNADDRIVVGYFSSSADASRAISELLDEGFQPSEIGAAFRASRTEMEVTAGGRSRTIPENPALSGSVGGPASHDQAVTPAGLAPGAGAAFPAASKPGPIPGGEIPSTLRHELPHELPSTLRHETEVVAAPVTGAPGISWEDDEERRAHMNRIFDDSDSGRRSSSMKFGTGEGHLFPDHEYSVPSFENSFVGMGLSARDARSLSGELGRGGAVVSVASHSRASLAQGIVERNHGMVRFESLTREDAPIEGARVEIYGRMRNYYRPEENARRKAS